MGHSHGPWRWAPRYASPSLDRPDHNPPDRIVDANGHVVLWPANVPNRDCDTFDDLLGTDGFAPGTADANAALIAAAPEILAMLRNLEWSGGVNEVPGGRDETGAECPICGGLKHEGHAGDCTLGGLLARVAKEGE